MINIGCGINKNRVWKYQFPKYNYYYYNRYFIKLKITKSSIYKKTKALTITLDIIILTIIFKCISANYDACYMI